MRDPDVTLDHNPVQLAIGKRTDRVWGTTPEHTWRFGRAVLVLYDAMVLPQPILQRPVTAIPRILTPKTQATLLV